MVRSIDSRPAKLFQIRSGAVLLFELKNSALRVITLRGMIPALRVTSHCCKGMLAKECWQRNAAKHCCQSIAGQALLAKHCWRSIAGEALPVGDSSRESCGASLKTILYDEQKEKTISRAIPRNSAYFRKFSATLLAWRKHPGSTLHN